VRVAGVGDQSYIGLERINADRKADREKIAELEAVEDKLQKIKNWCEAYPLDIFPEPDLKRAREALSVVGITLDSVSASNMRHVLKGVQDIIEAQGDSQ